MTDAPDAPRCRYAGSDRPRVVPGRHDVDFCPGEGCLGCLDCPSRHCVVCGSHHVEELTCIGCVAAARDDLTEIRHLCFDLRDHAVSAGRDGRLEAARPIPGGDAMVLISPGSDGRARAWARERGDDTTHQHDESAGDPIPPKQTLADLEDDWRQVIGHTPATGKVTIRDSVGYLLDNLDYAAQHHPAFDGCVTDIHRTRATLENVLHAGDRDDPAGVNCFDCGGTLVRKMTKHGMDDHWTCRRCRRRYTDPEYHLAVRARIEDEATA